MSYRDSHVGRGPDYHASFRNLPRRASLWTLEQRILPALVHAHFDTPPTHLDFACGTGRILGLLAPHVASSTGVDISSTMLQEAAQHAPKATLIHTDLTQHDSLADLSFDLITAFRFFPNAEPALRHEVLALLIKHLRPTGRLVFNNHCSDGALYARARHWLGRPAGPFMSRREVTDLLTTHKLRIIQRQPLGLLPLTDYRHPLPTALSSPIEAALRHVPYATHLAEEIVYTCVIDH